MTRNAFATLFRAIIGGGATDRKRGETPNVPIDTHSNLVDEIPVEAPPADEVTQEIAVPTHRPILIAGHSHVGALNFPDRTEAVQLLDVIDYPYMRGLAGPMPREDAYWEELVRISPAYDVVICFMGNQPDAIFLFKQDSALDFVSTRYPDLPLNEEADLIPENAVRERYKESFGPLIKVLAAITARPGARVTVIGTPAPKDDYVRLRGLINREPGIRSRVEAAGLTAETVEFSSPVVRLKAWGLLQDMMKEIAEAAGADFFPFPAVLCDERGYLKGEYYADVAHMNRAGGAIYLRLLAEKIRGSHDGSSLQARA
jgi:hypothetical protein